MEALPEPTLVEFIRYNNWANSRILEICLQLNPAQLAAAAPGVYGSIHRTLGHLVAAEADYINRMTGEGPTPPFKWEDEPALEAIAAFAAQVAKALLEAVLQIPPTQMVHEEEGSQWIDYQARQLFMQAVNHGIEHRTNVTTTLSSIGFEHPEIDNWGYMFAHAERFALKEGSV